MDMPETNTSIDFIKIPKVLTFYLEYRDYFDNVNMDPKVREWVYQFCLET
jgi:hypothetical protein